MSIITTADFQKGMFVNFKNEIHQITDFQFVNPGKGSAFVRTKFKNIKTGRVQEFTYKSGESLEHINVETHEMQYLYKENDKFVFMDNQSYEQIYLGKDILGSFASYLKESETYQILLHEGMPLGMRFPKKVRLLVIQADEAVKGNTVSGARKDVIVETGAVISAPLFIKKGDIIAIDPETGEYVSRESQK